MSTADLKMTAGFNSTAGACAVPEPICEARDLKRIMTDLANQIADTDAQLRNQNKHTQAIGQPRAIAGTGADMAPALRSAVAVGALDAYARRPRASRNEPVDNFDMVGSSPDDDDLIDRDAADALARLYEHRTDPSGVPPLDAVSASADRREITPDMPPVEDTAHQETKADTDSAAAPAFSSAPPASKSEIAAEVVTLQEQLLPAASMARTVEDDRAWLEERFADVASKLEQSLSGIRGHDSLDAFEERFTTLEQRLQQAVSHAATGADFSSLKSIESHVEDLNAQLVAVQTHFSRLDTIELELRSLADRLSTEELSKLLQHNAPKMSDNDMMTGAVANGMAQQLPRIEQTLQSIASQLSAEKIAGFVAQARQPAPGSGAIARMVANEISQLMPAAAVQHSDPSDRLDDLKATLETFVAERRHGDEQTNTMLDTMQQAMIRLLDRMDAIEQSGYLPSDGENADGQLAHRQAYEDTYAEAQQPPAPPPQPQMPEQPVALDHHLHRESRAPERDLPLPEPRSSAATEPRASLQQARPAEPTLAAVPVAAATVAASAETAANSRESFVAAARRAARMATEAPPEQEVTAEPAATPAKTRSPAKAAPGSRKLSTVSMALICLVLVGGSFVVDKMTILAQKGQQPAVQSNTPQSAPPLSEADKRIQNLEDADGAGNGTGQPAQRRSSIQNGSDRDLTGQPANGGAMPQIPGMAPGVATVPAALTKDATAENLTPRSNDLPPLAIGPNSLRTAAAKGDPSAEFEVGARFAEGRGVAQDLQQAVTWYQRAAAQGFAPAQYRLGSMFERGLGVKPDLAKARVWYQRAAEQGIVKAMHNLAVLTAGRDTAMTDYATAGKWFRAAADFGLTDSQFNLAIMYDSGLGLERDAKEAFKWFSLAARAGDEEAARRRESLRQKLQANEVMVVEAELANWRPKSADQAVNDPRLAGDAWKKSAR